MIRRAIASCLALGLVLSAPTVLHGQQSMIAVSEALSVEVLPGWREADGRHVAGLQFRLAPGWKTYWRSAGSTGISPQMDWRRSRNAASVTPEWPTPIVSGPPGSLSIGYVTDFVLPIVVQAADPARPIQLRGRLDIGVCRDVCLPARFDVSGVLPVAGQNDPRILAALKDRPSQSSVRATCTMRPTPDGAVLTGEMRLPSLGGDEAVVFELPDPRLWVTDANVRRNGDMLSAQSELMLGGGGALAVDRGQVRITVIGENGAVEVMGCSG
ncbi:MAG: protein-disulfide reductase DsbD domain-containing protein [Pseudomonadota bacterium]